MRTLPALFRGRAVRSGIDKRPVAAERLALSPINLEGDDQGDRTVHGGLDKAVYAYSADHADWWESQIGRPFGPGAFGENLTVTGMTESEVAIGDRWSWGDAVLEVCQPRTPCYKLTLHAGTARVNKEMLLSGRCGWYLRVLRTGTVPVAGPVTVEPHPDHVTILDVHRARYARDPGRGAALGRFALLADEWRLPFAERAGLAG